MCGVVPPRPMHFSWRSVACLWEYGDRTVSLSSSQECVELCLHAIRTSRGAQWLACGNIATGPSHFHLVKNVWSCASTPYALSVACLWKQLPERLTFISQERVALYLHALIRTTVRLECLDTLKKFIHLIGSRTLDLPACSIAP
jgi:hypothetical protein